MGGGGGSEEINIYGDMKILLISILGHHKIGLDIGVISMHSRFFLKVKVQNSGC